MASDAHPGSEERYGSLLRPPAGPEYLSSGGMQIIFLPTPFTSPPLSGGARQLQSYYLFQRAGNSHCCKEVYVPQHRKLAILWLPPYMDALLTAGSTSVAYLITHP